MPRRAVAQQRYTAPRRQPTRPSSRIRRNPAYRAGTVYTATVTNAGTLATAPTISYTSASSYASVYFENATAGKTVWLARALVNGDVLSVDFAARTVTLNGTVLADVVTVDSRWWELASGANTVRSNIPASVTHRDAYS